MTRIRCFCLKLQQYKFWATIRANQRIKFLPKFRIILKNNNVQRLYLKLIVSNCNQNSKSLTKILRIINSDQLPDSLRKFKFSPKFKVMIKNDNVQSLYLKLIMSNWDQNLSFLFAIVKIYHSQWENQIFTKTQNYYWKSQCSESLSKTNTVQIVTRI